MFSTRNIVVIVSALACFTLFCGAAQACVGARPLAMGGAYTGLADDIHATYWNPAGLTQLKDTSATWMRTSGNRDQINYQDYMAAAGSMGKDFAVGISWISYNLTEDDVMDQQDWYWLSMAYRIAKDTSVGVNFKEIRDSIAGVETGTAVDLGLLHKFNEQWTFGVLIQDANQPSTTDTVEGGSLKWVSNTRPGFSYRPDKQSVVTMEVYDVFDNANCQSLRVGYEKKVSKSLALRAGYYGLGNDGGEALTFGIGKTRPAKKSDSLSASSIDAAVMVGDIDTLLVSTSFKFLKQISDFRYQISDVRSQNRTADSSDYVDFSDGDDR